MNPCFAATLCLSLLAFPAVVAAADEPVADPAELPRVAARTLEEARAAIALRPGFRVEIAAAEPDIIDPVCVAFDERGRMFACEMRGYPERRDDALGRVRMLEDRDGDGRFETSTVFADGLRWPTGIACSGGGVFVAASPDILWLADRDGDGAAEIREVAFTGFGAGRDRLNVQALVNSLTWSPDGRLHGATAGNGGAVQLAGGSGPALDLNGRDFSFDPRTRDLRAESGTAQYGLTFDDFGNKFVCSNSNHLQAAMYERRYAEGRGGLPSPLASIAADGPAAPVFRRSPDEPWRVVRTRWRVAGKVGGPIEGGGTPSGYFTAATGLAIYRGDAYPAAYSGNAFIADAGSNLVHRKVLRESGAGWVAERPADEAGTEFLASADNWFRPCQIANAPDGCLYVVDMAREVIEHPDSLPGGIKRFLDLESGNDRGRIWRVAPDGFAPRAAPDLGAMAGPDLVRLLGHANAWHRETAARLLFERGIDGSADLLAEVAAKGDPRARLAALYLLPPQADRLAAALRDPDPDVRRHAVRRAESLAGLTGPVQKALADLARDPSPRVRFQLAFTLSVVEHPQKAALLALIAAGAKGDRWLADAAKFALAGADPAAALAALEEAAKSDPGAMQLAAAAAAQDRIGGSRYAALLAVAADAGPDFAIAAIEGAAPAFESGGAPDRAGFAAFAGPGLPMIWPALPGDARGLRALRFAPWPVAAEAFANATGDRESAAVAEIAALWPEGADFLIARAADAGADGAFRAAAARSLAVHSPERLVAAVGGGEFAADAVPADVRAALVTHPDPGIRAAAAKQLPAAAGSRAEALAAFLPAVELKGDARNGAEIFVARCAACHRAGQAGAAVGPDAVSLRGKGRANLLANIIDPNAEVAPAFEAHALTLKSGAALAGILVSKDASETVIRLPGGAEMRVAADQIASLARTGRSLMPEGLEAGLTPEQVADLLAYLEAL